MYSFTLFRRTRILEPKTETFLLKIIFFSWLKSHMKNIRNSRKKSLYLYNLYGFRKNQRFSEGKKVWARILWRNWSAVQWARRAAAFWRTGTWQRKMRTQKISRLYNFHPSDSLRRGVTVVFNYKIYCF